MLIENSFSYISLTPIFSGNIYKFMKDFHEHLFILTLLKKKINSNPCNDDAVLAFFSIKSLTRWERKFQHLQFIPPDIMTPIPPDILTPQWAYESHTSRTIENRTIAQLMLKVSCMLFFFSFISNLSLVDIKNGHIKNFISCSWQNQRTHVLTLMLLLIAFK